MVCILRMIPADACPYMKYGNGGQIYVNPINLCLAKGDSNSVTATKAVCNSDKKSVNVSYYSDESCQTLTSTSLFPLNTFSNVTIDCGDSPNAKPCNYVKYRQYNGQDCKPNGSFQESGFVLSLCFGGSISWTDSCVSNDEFIANEYTDYYCKGSYTPQHYKTGCNEREKRYQVVECNNQTSTSL